MDIRESCRAFLASELAPDLAISLDNARECWEESYELRRFAYGILRSIRPTVHTNPWRDFACLKMGFEGDHLAYPDFIRAGKWIKRFMISRDLIEVEADKFRLRQDPDLIYKFYGFLIDLAKSFGKDRLEIESLTMEAVEVKKKMLFNS